MSDETDRRPGAPDDGWTYDRYDWSRTPVVVGVVESVVAATGREATGVGPIHEYVETDALTALVDGGTAGGLSVRFAVDGVRVVVHDGGTVGVRAESG